MLTPLLLIGFAVLLLAFLARQLRRPTGWFGRRVMASLLNTGNRDLLDSALDVAAPAPGARVADVGFGGGYALDRLAALVSPERATGVEISEAMIAALRHRCGDAYDLHLADAAALPFSDASFDVLLSVSDKRVAAILEEAGLTAEIRAPRPGERIAVGTKGLS